MVRCHRELNTKFLRVVLSNEDKSSRTICSRAFYCKPFTKINFNLSYIGFRFLLSRSTIHAILFSRPVSVLASKYAFTYVFFTDIDIAEKFV